MSPYRQVQAYRCRCNRCGHRWTTGKIPKKCARCKSAYWNLPRVRKRRAPEA